MPGSSPSGSASGVPPATRDAGPAPTGPAPWLTLLGILLLALNLRAAIAGLAPLLPDVQRDLGMGRGMAGLLTTLPVLCFGLLSPAAARLGQ